MSRLCGQKTRDLHVKITWRWWWWFPCVFYALYPTCGSFCFSLFTFVRFACDSFTVICGSFTSSVTSHSYQCLTCRTLCYSCFCATSSCATCQGFVFSAQVDAGKRLEDELNGAGTGSCLFVSCDISKEEDIKVRLAVARGAAAWSELCLLTCLFVCLCLSLRGWSLRPPNASDKSTAWWTTPAGVSVPRSARVTPQRYDLADMTKCLSVWEIYGRSLQC